jgi:hypothetical protein
MRAALSSRRHGWAYGRPRSPARARRSHGRRPHGGANPRPVTRTRISSEGRPSRARARTPTLGKLTATRASHPVASGAPTSRPAGQLQVRRIREVARVRQAVREQGRLEQARVVSRIAPPRSQPGRRPAGGHFAPSAWPNANRTNKPATAPPPARAAAAKAGPTRPRAGPPKRPANRQTKFGNAQNPLPATGPPTVLRLNARAL